MLHRDYIKPGYVPEEMGDHFDLLFDNRHRGDYEDLVVFDAERVRLWFEPTKAFVDHVAAIIAREMDS